QTTLARPERGKVVDVGTRGDAVLRQALLCRGLHWIERAVWSDDRSEDREEGEQGQDEERYEWSLAGSVGAAPDSVRDTNDEGHSSGDCRHGSSTSTGGCVDPHNRKGHQ